MDGKFAAGQRQEKLAIARNLLAVGLNIEPIAQTTQLTLDEV